MEDKSEDMQKVKQEHQPNTLGYHRAMSAVFFGEDSPATKFLDEKIAASPNGEKEGVVAHESQVIFLLMHLDKGGNAKDVL